jgi:hypothetical protein
MAIKAKTKVSVTKGRIYIYCPKTLVEDSQFPFKKGDELAIRIEGRKLVIEKF